MNQLIGIKGGDNEKERSNDKEYTRKMIEHDEMGEGGKKKRRERENFRSSFETKETPSYLIPSHLSLPPVSALFPSLPPSPPPQVLVDTFFASQFIRDSIMNASTG